MTRVTAPTTPPKNESGYGVVVKFRSGLHMTTILSMFEVRGSIVGKVEAARPSTTPAATSDGSDDRLATPEAGTYVDLLGPSLDVHGGAVVAHDTSMSNPSSMSLASR
jgi:hypothetical protein